MKTAPRQNERRWESWLMRRFRVLSMIIWAVIAWLVSVPNLSAQVIECPGALPAARLDRQQVAEVAERLLQRFSAALGLHGLEAVDESEIMAAYQDRPEQLLTKLTYLTLQCQMLLMDSGLPPMERRRAVRRVFLDYVLAEPDMSASSLAAYVNDFASNGRVSDEQSEIDAEIAVIERALEGSPRDRWRKLWFIDPLARKRRGEQPRRWSVIVASPRYEDDGWRALRDHQERWPDVHFELDGPFDLESPHYAVVAGRGLDESRAARLLARIKESGMPDDSYVWQAPSEDDDKGSGS